MSMIFAFLRQYGITGNVACIRIYRLSGHGDSMLVEAAQFVYALAFLLEVAATVGSLRAIWLYDRKISGLLIPAAIVALMVRTVDGFRLAHPGATLAAGIGDLVASALVLTAIIAANPRLRSITRRADELISANNLLIADTKALSDTVRSMEMQKLELQTELNDEENRVRAIIAVEAELVSCALDVKATKTLIVTKAQELTRASGALIELIDGGNMVFDTVCGSAEPHLDTRVSLGGSFSDLAIKSGSYVKCDDAKKDAREETAECARFQARSMIVVPITIDERAIGALSVVSPNTSSFTEGDVRILHFLVHAIASTIVRGTAVSAATVGEQGHLEPPVDLAKADGTLAAPLDYSLPPMAPSEPTEAVAAAVPESDLATSGSNAKGEQVAAKEKRSSSKASRRLMARRKNAKDNASVTVEDIISRLDSLSDGQKATIFNLDEALAQFDGDRMRLGAMIAAFMKQAPEIFEYICDCIRLSDSEQAVAVIQVLRESALNIGAMALCEAADVLKVATIRDIPHEITEGLDSVEFNIMLLAESFNRVQVYDLGVS